MDTEREQAIQALIDYYFAAENAHRIGVAYGRRGASEEAVNTVNVARAKAKTAYDTLMDHAQRLAEQSN